MSKWPTNDLVTFLVEETFKLQEQNTESISSLEAKILDYQLNYLKGFFIPQTQMLRFKTPFGEIDIPTNWSLFSIENSMVDYSLVSEHNDQDEFFHVIQSAWGLPLKSLVITHENGFCFLIGLKSGEEVHLRDLLNDQEWLTAG